MWLFSVCSRWALGSPEASSLGRTPTDSHGRTERHPAGHRDQGGFESGFCPLKCLQNVAKGATLPRAPGQLPPGRQPTPPVSPAGVPVRRKETRPSRAHHTSFQVSPLLSPVVRSPSACSQNPTARPGRTHTCPPLAGALHPIPPSVLSLLPSCPSLPCGSMPSASFFLDLEVLPWQDGGDRSGQRLHRLAALGTALHSHDYLIPTPHSVGHTLMPPLYG